MNDATYRDRLFFDNLRGFAEQGIGLERLKDNYATRFTVALDEVKPFIYCGYDSSGKELSFKIEDKFYTMLKYLQDIVFHSYTPCQVADSIREFHRQCLTGELTYSYEDLCRFYSTYGNIVSRFHKAYSGIPMDRGDDSFGDLMDSLPLAGKDIIEGVLDRTLSSNSLLENAVTATLMDKVRIKFILHGENYVCSTLNKNLVEYLPSFAQGMYYK